ncbi:hypothetical protein Tco_0365693 [Tanacetum coccineum]
MSQNCEDDECIAYADALGIEVERVTHPDDAIKDIPEAAQEGCIEVMYETLGIWFRVIALNERIAELERDNRSLRAPRVLRVKEKTELRARSLSRIVNSSRAIMGFVVNIISLGVSFYVINHSDLFNTRASDSRSLEISGAVYSSDMLLLEDMPNTRAGASITLMRKVEELLPLTSTERWEARVKSRKTLEP